MSFHRWYRDRRYGSISSLCAAVMDLYCSSKGIHGQTLDLWEAPVEQSEVSTFERRHRLTADTPSQALTSARWSPLDCLDACVWTDPSKHCGSHSAVWGTRETQPADGRPAAHPAPSTDSTSQGPVDSRRPPSPDLHHHLLHPLCFPKNHSVKIQVLCHSRQGPQARTVVAGRTAQSTTWTFNWRAPRWGKR